MNSKRNIAIVLMLAGTIFIASCKKTTSEAGGTATGGGSGSVANNTVTETTTSIRVGGQPLPGGVIWLGRNNNVIYGYSGSVVFKLNPTTKRLEEAFRISFPGIAVSEVWPRFIKLTPEGDLLIAVKAPGNSTLISRLTLQGQQVWAKRVNFTYNQFYQEHHIDARSLNIFDNAVWLTCFRALVKLNFQTGAVLASAQLPFAAQNITTPVDVLPAGDQVMIFCRSSIHPLHFFFFDKNTLQFSHSIGRNITRNLGTAASSFSVNNAFVLSNNRLLFLTRYTHTGNAFFPISFGLVTDYQGNIVAAKYFTNHQNNIVEISTANRHSNGRFFAMLASNIDINIGYTYNIVSVDDNLNMIQSEAALFGNSIRSNGLMSPFPLEDNQVVMSNGTAFFWLNYQRIGCSKDPSFRFSIPQMDMQFGSIVRATSPPSFAAGISVQSIIDAETRTEPLTVSSTVTECKK